MREFLKWGKIETTHFHLNTFMTAGNIGIKVISKLVCDMSISQCRCTNILECQKAAFIDGVNKRHSLLKTRLSSKNRQ